MSKEGLKVAKVGLCPQIPWTLMCSQTELGATQEAAVYYLPSQNWLSHRRSG